MNIEQQKINEGNEKLAKFLGWHEGENQMGSWFEEKKFATYIAYSIHSNYPHLDLPFHRDWNYLMKVIDKIGCIQYCNDADKWKDFYTYIDLFGAIWSKWCRNHEAVRTYPCNLMNDIEGMWLCCVSWVEWHDKKLIEDPEHFNPDNE